MTTLRITTEQLAYNRLPASLFRVSYYRDMPRPNGKSVKQLCTAYFDTQEEALKEVDQVKNRQGYGARVDYFIRKKTVMSNANSEGASEC